MQELIKQVQHWANERGLNKPEQFKAQALKVIEEMGEMTAALLRINKEGERFIQMPKLIDGIGDLQVTLIVLCGMANSDYSTIENQDISSIESQDANDWALNIASWFTEAIGSNGSDARFEFYISAVKAAIIELCNCFELTPEKCLQEAYSEIKGRTGVLVNGTFVKDEK